jgi:hypothetical protein
MPRDVIPFRAGPTRSPLAPDAGPNPAFAALNLFRRLADTLAAAKTFRDACRTLERRNGKWGVPTLFFFARMTPAERSPTLRNFIAERYAVPVARRMPDAGRAWAALTDLIDDAFTACCNSVEVRRAARAVPHLRERLADFAPDHRACHELSALLSVADDFVVTVLHPAARAGFRFQLEGIVDLAQLHVLLADAVVGAAARGYVPGPRPDPRVVDAYLDQPTDPAADVATARFQMYRPTAVLADGTLPARFHGADEWLWGHESPHAIPAVNGERVLLLADAAYPRQWPVARRFAALNGGLQLVKLLAREEVDGWLATLSKQPAVRTPLQRAA